MNGDPRRRRDVEGGDDELSRALRSLGEGYEPDLTALQHRLRHADTQRGVIEYTTLRSSHPGSRAAVRPRQGWLGRPVMLPIAAVILVVGGIVALMSHRPGHDPAGTAIAPAGAVSAATLMPSPTISVTRSSDLPSRLGPAVSATEKSSDSPAPATSSQQMAPAGPQPAVTVWPAPANGRTPETLSRFGRYDWIALGARSDRRQVRAAESTAHPQVIVYQPANANVVYGPFRLSWTKGVPEDSRTDEGTWLRADGTSGWSMTLMPSPTTVRRLQLYMGTTNLKATVEIDGKDFVSQKFALQQSGSTPLPMTVEINVPRTSHHVYVHFSGTPTGTGSAASAQANFYLAGLTLRTNNQEMAATK